MAGITAYTGLQGSGKSYGVVKHVIAPALKRSGAFIQAGKPRIQVLTNIPMNDEECMHRFGATVDRIDIDDIKSDSFDWDEVLEKGGLLVLDEIWELWPSGLQQNKARAQDRELLAKHRHRVGENGRATEVILVTQDLGQVSSFVRQLISYTYHARKLDSVGMENRYNVNVYAGAVTGAVPPASRKVRSMKAAKYEPEIFPLYKSHTQSDAGAGDESKIDQRNNAMSGGFVKFLIVVTIVGIAGFGYVISGAVFGAKKAEADTVSSAGDTVSTPIESDTPAKIVPRRRISRPGVLEDIQQINIEMSNRVNGFFRYEFTAQMSTGQTSLNNETLRRLGVRVDSIDVCVSRLVSATSERLVYCRADTGNSSPGIGGFDFVSQ